MLFVRRTPSDRRLRAVVSGFTERRGSFAMLSSVRPLPARPTQILEFYLAERYRVRAPGGAFFVSPEAALVGPMTEPVAELAFQGTIETFTIHFQPTGLARLFRVPMAMLANEAPPAADVLGRSVVALEAAVRRAATFEARVAVAQAWLEDLLAAARDANSVDVAARVLARAGGRAEIAALSARAGLSPRQMQRRFIDSVGVAPKHYARLHRFAAAVGAREASPQRSWTDIAHAFGFSDQAHLAREFRALAGRAPGDYFTSLAGVPETAAERMSDSFKPRTAIAR